MSRDFHVIQALASSCVAACVVIIERWRGVPGAEALDRQTVVFGRIAVGGFGLFEAAAVELGDVECSGYLDIDNPNHVLYLISRVQHGCWAMVSCFTDQFAQIAAGFGLSSPLGPLRGGAAHHAVVIVDARGDGVALLDPWHLAEMQPIWIGLEDFARIWTGQVIIAQPSAGGAHAMTSGQR